MARKEINIFSVSFLDLLSGALGAIILLFILVPKFNITVEEFEEQKQLTAELDKLGIGLEDIKNTIPKDEFEKISEKFAAVEKQMQAVKDAKEALEMRIAGLQEQLQQMDQQNKKLVEENTRLNDLVKQLQQEIEKKDSQMQSMQVQIDDLKKYKEWMDRCGHKPDDPCPDTGIKADIGFKFKGKDIVFLVDRSGSMVPSQNNQYEDRLTKVKAGVNMLITLMGTEFNSDVTWFAGDQSTSSQYGSGFGNFRSMTESNKRFLISELYSWSANGGTPTYEGLNFVLDNYPNATDIVLISDGEPNDDVYSKKDIIQRISSKNKRTSIHCMAVGSHLVQDPNHEAALFMKELAARNNGFYYIF
ncbi:MAG: VWA domain-containing protein [Cyclobacteriaceae bacterium]|nr:VWA domain-containing protein [Cyclobacteriaceae bacterium]